MRAHTVNRSIVLELPDFFDKAFCQNARQRAEEASFEEQVFYGGEVRERAVFDSVDFAKSIWQRLPTLPNLASMYGPSLRPEPDVEQLEEFTATGLNPRHRIYRYTRGARFSRHHDISYEAELRSFLTLLIYLDEQMEGGHTTFDEGLGIAPARGTCVIFPHELMHQGMPVTSGTKTILRTDVMFAYPP